MNLPELRLSLKQLAEGNEKYAEFNKRIVNTSKTILGARTPDIRNLAKATAKNATFDQIKNLLNEIDNSIYEEVALAGLIINYAKLSDLEELELTQLYLKKVDNWALIDTFVEKKRRTSDSKLWWDYSLKTLKSNNEFIVRYGIINLMSNFLGQEYIDQTLRELRHIKHEGYYVKMGLAWLYATAAIQHFDIIIVELSQLSTDPWTRNKAYQKMLESYRIPNENKTKIRALRTKSY